VYLDVVKFKIKKKIELEKTFNLHPNFTHVQGVWPLSISSVHIFFS